MSDPERGRSLVLVILGTVLGLDLLVVAATSFVGGDGFTLRGGVRLVLTAALGWAVLSGRSWARWLMGVLLLLGALGGIVSAVALTSFASGSWLVFVLGAMALVHGAAGVTLLASPSITAYLRRVS